MEYNNILLIIHVAAGTMALLSGGGAILSSKGSSRHSSGGRVFVWSMWITGLSAIFMSLIRPQMFLLAVGVFTLYMVTAGWIWGKPLSPDRKNKSGRLVGIAGLLSALFLFITGWIYGGEGRIILWVFGGIQATMAGADVFPVQPKQFIIRHISRMGGAYIAAVTAFMVVNLTHWPDLLVWLGPSLVGTVLITLGAMQWKRRMES